jgi:predicted transcriptional regulator of viral defense system
MDSKLEILNSFSLNKGFLCAEDIKTPAQRYHLSKMLQSGEIERIKKGVYLLTDGREFDERVLVSKMYPGAVFCLFSAWEYYQLTTSIPVRHYLAIRRDTKLTKSPYPPVQLHYWTTLSFNPGIVQVMIDNHAIRMYDMEKSVCDAIKHRAKIGEDIAIEVVKKYAKSKDRNIEKLMKYGNGMKISKSIENYLKPLL